MSSSSRTSSSLFCVPNNSRDSLACTGEEVKDIEEADDLEECPRDHTETVGEEVDDIDGAGTWCKVAILNECESERVN